MTNTLITLQDVNYQIGNKQILRNISFTIDANQTISVLGYNGSGKSTLLKLLLGSIKPTSGKIIKSQGLKIGYVPQKISFQEELPITVADFLTIYANGSTSTVSFPCSMLDIQGLMNKPLHGLSGGQLQKVLFHNALIGNPNILLLDEPTAGLDITAQQELYSLLDHLRNEHSLTIVLVSHDIHTVYKQSDLVICLHQGVCCSGCPGDQGFNTDVSSLFEDFVVPYFHTHNHDS